MYHLIGVVYRIRRYTGVYRLPCMLLFPDLFCLVNQFKQKHAAQAVSSQAVEGSTLQKGSGHQYIYCKLSLISYVFSPSAQTILRLTNRALTTWKEALYCLMWRTTDHLHPLVTDVAARRLRNSTTCDKPDVFCSLPPRQSCVLLHTQCIFTVNHYIHT